MWDLSPLEDVLGLQDKLDDPDELEPAVEPPEVQEGVVKALHHRVVDSHLELCCTLDDLVKLDKLGEVRDGGRENLKLFLEAGYVMFLKV